MLIFWRTQVVLISTGRFFICIIYTPMSAQIRKVHCLWQYIPGNMFRICTWLVLYRLYHQFIVALRWRHNDHDGVSNHQPRGCLLNRLFTPRSKKTSKLRVTGLCAGNSPGPVNSPHKGPVTRKMLPFDDVIMDSCFLFTSSMDK